MIESRGVIKVRAVINKKTGEKNPDFLSQSDVKAVRKFHSTFAHYRTTPLVSLDNLARELNVKKIFIKDEAHRFGLDAFKVLGGTYAIAKLLCKKLGLDINDVNFDYFKSEDVKRKLGDMTFVTATDGNHGRGVAWAASQLGQKAVVFLPKGSAKRRVDAIRETGAEAVVTDLNYDDTVHLAIEKAKENGWHIVQDTAWDDYQEIPRWIMQGYTTMADEVLDQLKEEGFERPTHVFLQAGVGSMAGAILGYYLNVFNEDLPETIIVEPDEAACFFKSASIGDGKPHNFNGDLLTQMVGLACGEPNPIAWEILWGYSSAFISCPDYISARGMRILANPLGNDKKIISGESGAVSIGLLSLLMKYSGLAEIREKIGLDEDSVILLFNTEGATDPVNYQRVLWDGANQLPISV